MDNSGRETLFANAMFNTLLHNDAIGLL